MIQKSTSEYSGDSEKNPRGLAALPPKRRKEIAQLGGWAAHAKGVAHLWNEQEQKAAIEKSARVRKMRKDAEKYIKNGMLHVTLDTQAGQRALEIVLLTLAIDPENEELIQEIKKRVRECTT